jgi:hypothetical protein
MSEAMAISCDNFATVMTIDTKNNPQNGIWVRFEQPALQRTGNTGGQVDTVSVSLAYLRAYAISAQIVAIDGSGGNLVEVWNRGGTLQAVNATAVLSKREYGTDRCYSQSRSRSGSEPLFHGKHVLTMICIIGKVRWSTTT